MPATIDTIDDAAASHVAYHPDGERWAVADAATVRIGHDRSLDGPIAAPGPVHHLTFSPDGERLLVCPASYDVSSGEWDRPSLDAAITSGLDVPPDFDRLDIVAGAFAPDGRELAIVTRYVASRELDAVESYDGPTERLLAVDAGGELRGVLATAGTDTRAVTFSDRYVAAGGAAVTVWDRATLEVVGVLERHRLVVRALAFDATGERLAAVDAAGDVSVWEPAVDHLVASWSGHGDDGRAIAWHPGGALLASAAIDDHVRLWSPEGDLLGAADMGSWPVALAFAPDGQRLLVSVHDRPPRLVFLDVASEVAATS